MTRAFGPEYARGELSGDAARLLPALHRTPEGRRAAVARAAARGLPPASREALREASATLPASPARAAALTALDHPDVSVVVTGQQVGLFVGPLYSLWKAATAVALAARLADEAGTPVIPVFWLQTEDHDLAEVAQTSVSDPRGGVHAVSVPDDGRGRVAIAHRVLPEAVAEACDRVAALLTGLPHADAAVARLREAWRPGRPWAEAFTELLGHVFADTPLLVLQPRSAALAQKVAGLHRWALEEHEQIASLLDARAEALTALDYAVQVPPRPDCSLSAYHPDGPDGPRCRLRRTGDGWALADGTDRPVSVADALETTPLSFSSSALLRPLVQDTLLPTAAYVGGPGELSYWAQLPPLYALRGLPLPMVVPRATGVVVDDEARQALGELGLAAAEVDEDAQGLLLRLGPPPDAPDFEGLAARVRAAVAAALKETRGAAAALDPDLVRHIDRTCDSAERDAGKLEQRLVRAAARSDTARVAAARRAVARLRPAGRPQDRASCWPDLAARVGVDAVGPLLVGAVSDALARGEGPLTDSAPLEVPA